MKQPPSFVDTTQPEYICKPNRALYGLKQAPRAWYHRFISFICSKGFINSKADSSMFVYRRG